MSGHIRVPLPPAIPILVIQGAMDEVMPPANAEALRATAPERVSVVTIDGARDLFPLTHVGETAWPIIAFKCWWRTIILPAARRCSIFLNSSVAMQWRRWAAAAKL